MLTVTAVMMIRSDSVDHRVARCQTRVSSREDFAEDNVSGLHILLHCRPLRVLATALALFHLGNAAMWPLYGLAIVAARQGAQCVCRADHRDRPSGDGRRSDAREPPEPVARLLAGHLLTFLALPLRGLLAASLIQAWRVWRVQILVAWPNIPPGEARKIAAGRPQSFEGMAVEIVPTGRTLNPEPPSLFAPPAWSNTRLGGRIVRLVLACRAQGESFCNFLNGYSRDLRLTRCNSCIEH
jgi:hypothetical protein